MKAFLIVTVQLLLCCALPVCAQLSSLLGVDTQDKSHPSRSRQPVSPADIIFGVDASKEMARESKCHRDMDMEWSSSLSSAVYATPIIADIDGDGTKEIIIAEFSQFVEVLDGRTGHRRPGWPFALPGTLFHASPILYDVDGDGVREIMLSTYNAEVVFVRANGLHVHGTTLKIPPLPVRVDWMEGMSAKDVDVSLSMLHHEEEEPKASVGEVPDEPLVVVPKEDNEQPTRTLMSTDENDEMRKGYTEEALESFELFLGDVPSELAVDVDNVMFSPEWSQWLEDSLKGVWGPVFGRDVNENRKPRDDAAMGNSVPSRWVLVDAHIVATPTLADLDGNGHYDLIVPVSYFFDRDQWREREDLPSDVDIANYVASGIVVIDLKKRAIRWSAHLDLTTDFATYRAYTYSTPSVGDIDGDGHLDIVMGTSVGFVYALDRDGSLKDGFPVMMDEVQGQITLADVTGDGALELLVADNNANLVCLSGRGEVIWETRVSGFPSQAPSVGDVNGDGILDVILGTNAGHIWAFRGDTGERLPSFPIKTDGRILAPVTLTHLAKSHWKERATLSGDILGMLAPGGTVAVGTSMVRAAMSLRGAGSMVDGMKPTYTRRGLQILVPSFDGHIYVVDGYGENNTTCVDKIDVGENAYAAILVDDMTGDDRFDILLFTMSGNAYCFASTSQYMPLAGWSGGAMMHNGLVYREAYEGIMILGTRSGINAMGRTLSVDVLIEDTRPHPKQRLYRVRISLGGSIELGRMELVQSGVRTITVPSPRVFMQTMLVVEMEDEVGNYDRDEVPIMLNVGFKRALKILLLFPFVLFALVVGIRA